MITAIFGIVGVVIGSVLSAILNYELQRRQEARRWAREDEGRYQSERLRLYREFLAEIQTIRTGGSFNKNRLWSMLAEMELLSSYSVERTAVRLFDMAEVFYKSAKNKDFLEKQMAEAGIEQMEYEFIKSVRKELGVPKVDERPEISLGQQISHEMGGEKGKKSRFED